MGGEGYFNCEKTVPAAARSRFFFRRDLPGILGFNVRRLVRTRRIVCACFVKLCFFSNEISTVFFLARYYQKFLLIFTGM